MPGAKYTEVSTSELLCDGDGSESGEASGTDATDEYLEIKPEWLPNWLYTSKWGVPREVQKIMKEKIDKPDLKLGKYGRNLTMFDVSGPAVKLLWIATVLHWSFALVFPFVAFQFTHCNGLGLPSYHVLLWALVAPIFAIMLAIEWRCFTYVITPIVQSLDRMDVAGLRLPFHTWLFAQVCLTVVASADVITQGLLLSSTCRWFTCPGWNEVAAAWVDIWNSSLFARFTPGRDLEMILILTWGLALVQLPLFILAALPFRCLTSCQNVSFDLGSERNGYHVSTCWPSLDTSGTSPQDPEAEHCGRIYCTWSKIWHADALKTLTTLNRMTSISCGLFPVQLKRAEIALESGDQGRCCQILKMELRQMIPRIFLINLFQNCTKLEVQTTIFALGRMVAPNKTNWQCLLCIVLAQLMSIYDLFVISSRANKITATVEKCISQPASREISRNSKNGSGIAVGTSSPNEDNNAKQICWLNRFVWLASCLCLLVQLHSIAKLVGAFVCEDAIWNFPNICADVRAY